MEAIDEVDAKIDALPRGSMERKMLQRCSTGSPFRRRGRDGPLGSARQAAQQDRVWNEAFFIAAGDTFQIWKPETYEAEELSKTEEWLGRPARRLRSAGLPDGQRQASGGMM